MWIAIGILIFVCAGHLAVTVGQNFRIRDLEREVQTLLDDRQEREIEARNAATLDQALAGAGRNFDNELL